MQAPTTGSTDLDVKSIDTQLLASRSNVLRGQHGSVGRGFITVSFDLHATGDTTDSFTAAGITQNISHFVSFSPHRGDNPSP